MTGVIFVTDPTGNNNPFLKVPQQSMHVVVASGSSGGGNTNYLVSLFTDNGTVKWTVTYTIQSVFGRLGAAVDSSGNAIVLLSDNSTVSKIVRFAAADGTVLATYSINLPSVGGAGIDASDNLTTVFPHSLFTVDKNGNVTQNISVGSGPFLLAVLPDGTIGLVTNHNTFTIYPSQTTPSITGIQCLGGGLGNFLSGQTDNNTFSTVTKLTEAGGVVWTANLHLGGGNNQFATSIDGDNIGNVFAAIEVNAASNSFSLQRYTSIGGLVWTVPNFPNLGLQAMASASGCIVQNGGTTYSSYRTSDGVLQWTNTIGGNISVMGRQAW